MDVISIGKLIFVHDGLDGNSERARDFAGRVAVLHGIGLDVTVAAGVSGGVIRLDDGAVLGNENLRPVFKRVFSGGV